MTRELGIPAEVEFGKRRYRLGRPLRHGAWGPVYEAADSAGDGLADGGIDDDEPTGTQPRAAVEVVGPSDQAHRDAVEADWRRLQGLRGDGVLEILAWGAPTGAGIGTVAGLYLATEAYDASLADDLALGRQLSLDAAAAVLRGVAQALRRMHEAGLSHGAVGPGTIVRVGRRWKLAPGGPSARDDQAPREVGWSSPQDDVQRLGQAVLSCLPPGGPDVPHVRAQRLAALGGVWRALLEACLDPAPCRRPPASRLALGPIEPPPAVDGVVAAREGDDYRLTWTPPPRGEVRLLEWTAATHHTPGEVVPAADLDRLGRGYEVARAGPGWAVVRIDDPRASRTVVPVTVDGAAATVGRAVVLSPIDDVTSLRCTIRGGWLHAQWDWPAGVQHTRVVLAADRWPDGPDDLLADTADFSRANYDMSAGFLVRPPRAEERVHVVVYSADYHSTARFASGSSDGARRVLRLADYRTVHYRVAARAPGARGELRFELVIRPDAPAVLPELVLRAMPGGPPLHPREGHVLLIIEKGLRCGPNRPVRRPIRPPEQPGVSAWTVRLFPTDDHECDRLTLDPGPDGWPQITR